MILHVKVRVAKNCKRFRYHTRATLLSRFVFVNSAFFCLFQTFGGEYIKTATDAQKLV